ncbi:hypothetical protein CRH01_34200 [Chryseobacterium rhizosphaerae]|nr:hypothetical protein CRH01_34200 [Chryseobacterium rhizosphaerae]
MVLVVDSLSVDLVTDDFAMAVCCVSVAMSFSVEQEKVTNANKAKDEIFTAFFMFVVINFLQQQI